MGSDADARRVAARERRLKHRAEMSRRTSSHRKGLMRTLPGARAFGHQLCRYTRSFDLAGLMRYVTRTSKPFKDFTHVLQGHLTTAHGGP